MPTPLEIDHRLRALCGMSHFVQNWMDEALNRLDQGEIEGALAALSGLDRMLVEMRVAWARVSAR